MELLILQFNAVYTGDITVIITCLYQHRTCAAVRYFAIHICTVSQITVLYRYLYCCGLAYCKNSSGR